MVRPGNQARESRIWIWCKSIFTCSEAVWHAAYCVGIERCGFIRLRLQQLPIIPSRSNRSSEKEELTGDRAEELSSVHESLCLLVTKDPDSRTRSSRCTLHTLPPATTAHAMGSFPMDKMAWMVGTTGTRRESCGLLLLAPISSVIPNLLASIIPFFSAHTYVDDKKKALRACCQDWLVFRKSGSRRETFVFKSCIEQVAPGFLYISHRRVLTVRAACNNKKCDAEPAN